jgi:SagB-type dehydrogenase family enzyme
MTETPHPNLWRRVEGSYVIFGVDRMVEEESKMENSSLLKVLKRNTRLTRRQACQLGGLMGLSFSAVSRLWARPVWAKSHNISNKEVAMRLPDPTFDGNISVEETIKNRRTVRSYSSEPITLAHLSQILWAAQGITEDGGFKRAAPSGGALYPIDVYVAVGQGSVKGLREGTYRYDPSRHSLEQIAGADVREDIAKAALRQMWAADAPVIVVLTAEYRRITVKYGGRGGRYAMIEVGHIGQNIFLQCNGLGLSAGIIGAFNDSEVAKAVSAEKDHEPLIIMPVGWQR